MAVEVGNLLLCVSAAVAQRLAELNWTQKQLAEAMWISQSRLSNYLSGRSPLTIDILQSLAAQLKTTPATLVTPAGAAPPASRGHLDDVPDAFETARVVRWLWKTPEGKAFVRELLEEGPAQGSSKKRQG